MVTTRSGKSYGSVSVVSKRAGPAKKGRNVRKKTVRSSAALVKRVLYNMAETKRFVGADTAARLLSSQTVYSINPLYWITNGSGDSQRVGDQIQLVDLMCNFSFYPNRNATSGGPDAITGYVMVVKCDTEEHDGASAPAFNHIWTGPEVRVTTAVGARPANPIVDTNVFTVLYRKDITIPAQTVGTVSTAGAASTNANSGLYHYNFVVPMKGERFQFKSASSGYGKFHNYYVLFCFEDLYGATSPVGIAGAYMVNFKDL